VAYDIAGGDFDRRGAGVGGERGWGAEPGDVSDTANDLPGGQIADAA
jgi:hypothetical protein